MRKHHGTAGLALLGAALVFGGAGAASDTVWDAREAERYDACLAKTKTDPETAFEDGLAWRDEGGGSAARHCIALALWELGRLEEAAARLEAIAFAPDAGERTERATLLLQAGNAWLLATQASEAERAFSQGLLVKPGDPDLLIDRARAYAMLERPRDADEDLSQALEARPADPLALRLRADARLAVGRLNGAVEDVRAALAIAPDDIETLLVRGRIREAQRAAGLDLME